METLGSSQTSRTSADDQDVDRASSGLARIASALKWRGRTNISASAMISTDKMMWCTDEDLMETL